MPFYKVPIASSICVNCTARATHEIFNSQNAAVGFYCDRHADRELKGLNKKFETSLARLRELGVIP